MSGDENKKKDTAKEPQKKINLYEVLEEQNKKIDALSDAMLTIAKRVDEGGGAPAKSEETGFVGLISKIIGGEGRGGGIADVAKSAESLARLAESLDRFRNPARMSYGDALLMRLGVRAAYPRYMTRAEMRRLEKQMGIMEGLSEEGETEHLE